MDLLASLRRPYRTRDQLIGPIMEKSRIGFLIGLTDFMKDFYKINSTPARFFNLFRVEPLSILAPLHHRFAGLGG